jgi:hypothetical protein
MRKLQRELQRAFPGVIVEVQRTMTTKSNQRSPAMDNNEVRRSAALTALNAYRYARDGSPRPTGDMEETIYDLVADLCHLAAQHGVSPLDMLKSAAAYYAAEAVDDTGQFLEVLVTLEVVARPVPTVGEQEEDFQEFNDQSAATWRAQAQVEFAKPQPKLTIVR